MPTTTWNQQVVKKNNKSLVLETIMTQEPLSRADIAQRSGLNKATVSSLVNELIDEELIFEAGPGESSGGRRPVLLHFNKEVGHAIGIDIGVNYILGILTDLRGNIIYENQIVLNDHLKDQVIDLVTGMIETLIQHKPHNRYGIVGIGVGVPGIIDTSGEILLAPNLGWSHITLKTLLEERFQIPIIVENEANAGAYGEKHLGIGQTAQNLVYISAGIGIGVGIIIDGELYRGKSGYSGEMGHMIIDMGGRPCRCGSFGCWEAYASEYALLNEANGYDSLEELIKEANQGNEEVQQLFNKVGTYLGYGINNIINTFNPEQIIIGNRLAKAKTWIEEPVNKIIKQFTLPFQQKELKIDFAKLTTYSAALGVSAFVVENFIKTSPSEL